MRSSFQKFVTGVALAMLVLSMAPEIAYADSRAECETRGGTWGVQSIATGGAQSCSVPPPSSAANQSSGISDTIGTFLSDVVYWIGPGIASYAAWIGAYVFSFSVEFSLNSTAYAIKFLADGWQVVRDLGNMAFIFILIYISIVVMLRANTSDTVKQLIWVIIIAVLVNFSFFFTRVVIDAGNILSLQFYNAIPIAKDANGQTSPNAFLAGTNGNVKDLSASIMDALKVQTLLGQNVFKQARTSCSGQGGDFGCALIVTTVVYIAVAAMLWMLFFAFLQVGIKFILRIVGLWFLLIASPLAFIARTIPKFESYFTMWWKLLVKFSFYPAIFLFMFLIITKFAGELLTSGTGSILTGAFEAGKSSGGTEAGMTLVASSIAAVGIRLGFVIALMYVALHVSEWIVKEGSEIAGKVGSWKGWAGGTIRGALRYGPGWASGAAYRQTVGRGANRLSEVLASSKWANKTGTLGGVIGYRLNKNVAQPLKNTSLGTVASSWNERQKFLKERKGVMTTNLRDRENKDAITAAGDTATANIAAGRTATDTLTSEQIRSVQKLNKRELEAMSADHITKMAALLTEDQIKRVQEMEKLTDKQKEEIKTTWEAHSTEAPLQKADKHAADLGRLSSAPSATTAATSGTTINKALTATIKTEISSELDQAKAEHKTKEVELEMTLQDPTATPALKHSAKLAYGIATTQMRNAQSAVEKASELDKELDKVSTRVGGTPNAKEFIKK